MSPSHPLVTVKMQFQRTKREQNDFSLHSDMSNQKKAGLWSITTSLRSDPQLASAPGNPQGYYMIEYHRERLLAAAHDFGWQDAEQRLGGAEGLSYLMAILDDQKIDPAVKVRVLANATGQLTVSLSAVPKVAIEYLFPTNLTELSKVSNPVWRIFISPIKTTPSKFTKHKTTSRDSYNVVREQIPTWARAAAKPELEAEILLVNPNGNIMEGSITTPYFLRKEKWVTPPVTSGGNIGTTRRYALENNLCSEEEVRFEEVQIGERVWLSNGVRGWGLGFVNDLEH